MANTPDSSIDLEEMVPGDREAPQPMVERSAADLEAVFDVPVRISVVLGRARIPIASLLRMDIGTVVELASDADELDSLWVERWLRDRIITRIPGGRGAAQ